MFRNINFDPITHLKNNTVNFSSLPLLKSLAVPSPRVLIYAWLTEIPAAVKKKKIYRADAQIWRRKPSGKLQPGHIVSFSRTNLFRGFRLATGKGRTLVTCRGQDREARGFVCGAKWACPQMS